MVLYKPEILRWDRLAKSFGLVTLGLAPYLLIPIFAKGNPFVNWGEIDSLSRLASHMLREEYGTFQLTKNHYDANLFHALFYFLKDSFRQGFYLLAPLSIFGFGIVWKNRSQNKFGLAWAVSFLFFVVVFHTMVNKDWRELQTFVVMTRFWQQANLVFWIFSGWAVFHMVKSTKISVTTRSRILTVGVTAMISLLLIFNYRDNDQSQNDTYDRYARWMLDTLPEKQFVTD